MAEAPADVGTLSKTPSVMFDSAENLIQLAPEPQEAEVEEIPEVTVRDRVRTFVHGEPFEYFMVLVE